MPGWYFPGGHRWHCWLVEFAKVPTPQGVQEALDAFATLPGLHGVHDVAAALEDVPAGQGAQLTPLRNVPEPHDAIPVDKTGGAASATEEAAARPAETRPARRAAELEGWPATVREEIRLLVMEIVGATILMYEITDPTTDCSFLPLKVRSSTPLTVMAAGGTPRFAASAVIKAACADAVKLADV